MSTILLVRIVSRPCEYGSKKIDMNYPAWSTYIDSDMENGPVEIVDLPIKNGGKRHSVAIFRYLGIQAARCPSFKTQPVEIIR